MPLVRFLTPEASAVTLDSVEYSLVPSHSHGAEVIHQLAYPSLAFTLQPATSDRRGSMRLSLNLGEPLA